MNRRGFLRWGIASLAALPAIPLTDKTKPAPEWEEATFAIRGPNGERGQVLIENCDVHLVNSDLWFKFPKQT